MFAYGLAGFGLTSVLCGLAPNMELLILGRVLQGAAGAMLVPGSLSIITATFEGEEQGRAFGIWAAASALTAIIGPLVGGAAVAYISWRAAFLINVPLIALALWASLTHMAETRDAEASGQFDWFGSFIVVLAVGGLTFGTIRGQSQQWQDPVAFIALVLGGLATIGFPLWMARSPHPLVPLDLFRSRNFSVTNISTLLIYGAIYVSFQFIALFTIGILGYNEIGSGVATIPAAVLLAAFSTRFGKLAARHGPRIFMTVGPALMGLGLLWFVRFPLESSPWAIELDDLSTLLPPRGFLIDLLPAQILFGFGLAVMVAPLTTALMRSVPVRHSGVSSAFNNAISRVGPQLAGALLFVAITSSFYATLEREIPRLDTSAATVREEIAPLNPVEESLGEDVARAAAEASTDAFHLAMLVAALLCFGGAAVNGVGIRNEPQGDRESDTAIPGIAH